jgi:MFS family permease
LDKLITPVLQPVTERRRAFRILFVSLVGMGAGQSVMFAILPTLARVLGLTELQASLPFVVSAAIWVFTSSYWGAKSDHWGRKPVILIGLGGFGLSFALFAAFANLATAGVLSVGIVFPLMIASRALYGIVGSGASPAAQAYVADRTSAAERVSGVATITAAFGLGTTIGPVIGAVLVVFGLFAPFYFTAAAALLGAAAIWTLLPEHSAPRLRRVERSTLRWYDRRALPFMLYGTGIYTAGAIPLQIIGFFIIDVLHPGRAPQWTGLGLAALASSALAAQLAVTRQRAPKANELMWAGAAIAIVSFLLIAVSRDLTPLVIAMALNGLGLGLVRPAFGAAASLAVGPHEQGAMAGLVGATAGAGFIFGPLIATSLYRISPQAPFLFGAALSALCLAYGLWSRALARGGNAEIFEDTPALL